MRRFKSPREAALALLNCKTKRTRKTGQFLGQLAATNPARLSNLQAKWLEDLLGQAGLPRIRTKGGQ